MASWLPLLLVLFGSTLVAVSAGYAWWVRLRVAGFKADLLAALSDLRDMMVPIGGLYDPAYHDLAKRIFALTDSVADLSLPVLWYMHGIAGENELTPRAKVRSANPQVQQVLDQVEELILKRVVNHLLFDTVSGRLLWLLMKAVPSKVAKEEVTSTVREGIEPLEQVRTHSVC
jgi:hypothetical protein